MKRSGTGSAIFLMILLFMMFGYLKFTSDPKGITNPTSENIKPDSLQKDSLSLNYSIKDDSLNSENSNLLDDWPGTIGVHQEALKLVPYFMLAAIIIMFIIAYIADRLREQRYSRYYLSADWIKNIRLNNNVQSKEQKIKNLQLKNDQKQNKINELTRTLNSKNKELSLVVRERQHLKDSIELVLEKLKIPQPEGVGQLSGQLIVQKLDQIESIQRYLERKKNFTDAMMGKIGDGKTKEVIESLVSYAREQDDKKLLAKSVHISARFKNISNNQHNGTADPDKTSRELLAVNQSLIDLLIDYEKEV